MPISNNLRSRVALLCATLVISLSVLLGGTVWWRASLTLEEEAGQALGELSFQLADKLARDMAMRVSEVQVLSHLIPLPDQAARDSTQAHKLDNAVNSFTAAFPNTAWIGVIDPAGVVISASNGLLVGMDISARPVFRNGSKGLFVGDVHEAILLASLLPPSPVEPLRFVDVAVPLHDVAGEFRGVLAAHFSWAWARQVERSVMEPAHHRNQVDTFILSQNGEVLLGPEMLGKRLSLDVLNQPRQAASGWLVESWPDGKHYLTGYARSKEQGPFAGLGWTILTRQPLAVARAPATDLMQHLLMLGVSMAALFSVAGWLLARQITAPLAEIAHTAEQIRIGRIGMRFPERSAIAEVRALSQSLRALTDTLTRKDRALARLEGLAYHDTVSGLPNRLHLDRTLTVLAENGSPFAILAIDMDGFKQVNDLYGHQVGDKLLGIIGHRILSCLPGTDFPARIGGDEFMILVIGDTDLRQRAVEMARRVNAAIAEPMVIDGHVIHINCSIGVTLWPEEAEDFETALGLADTAMYLAKRRRLGFVQSLRGTAFPVPSDLANSPGRRGPQKTPGIS
ncbi:GGDEF domain-containing protein [Niveispirillum irakense]|uniref:GGDEF domain-containing protein n=1 Tax=Niveispirillum irakense TaxID=34011 RepID=UPI00040ADAE0|nr:GGDEF domain-containing protein [Niveispirillum irakense]